MKLSMKKKLNIFSIYLKKTLIISLPRPNNLTECMGKIVKKGQIAGSTISTSYRL
jgi:hypothetical protein